jgi:hypothetical protein
MVQSRQALFFLLLSAVVWIVFVPFYSALFSWAEHSTWINWLYLPHGLRVVLVLLFGLVGAVGFTLGAQILRWTLRPSGDVPLELDVLLGIAPAVAVWLALCITFKEQPWKNLVFGAAGRVAALEGRRLLALALTSALLSSVSHVALWQIFTPDMRSNNEHYLAMFAGDFLGAVALLYALKFLVVSSAKLYKNTNPYGRKEK